jgi:outer membrane lipoprotein carrier protein
VRGSPLDTRDPHVGRINFVLHAIKARYVISSVRLWLSITALLVCANGVFAREARTLDEACKSVERRYNGAKSLSAHFDQRYRAPGRLPRAESGELVLRKPARMRWDYSAPAGKTFVSDGKSIWFYSPAAKKVERSPLKESDDLRAPLAFLLGKLDFHREFGDLTLQQNGADIVIEALPKSGRLPYRRVDFTVAPDNQIRRVVVTGQDQSVMDFSFSNEKLNATVAEAAFHFIAPPGIPVVNVESVGEEEPR